MNYIEINCFINPFELGKEIITAELSNLGFESFTEADNMLMAYIKENDFDQDHIMEVVNQYKEQFTIDYTVKVIPQENWNAVWESNFEPVVINDLVLVKAPFHQIEQKYKYEIVIEPKMSFGTAHHETTSLMMQQMMTLDLNEKVVLDMGCGTAILAIFAKMLNAGYVEAIDNDDWAYQNSIENIHRNNFEDIVVKLGGAEILDNRANFDVILANINKNILLNDVPSYAKTLKNNAYLMLSGFYFDDLNDIKNLCLLHKLTYLNHLEKNNWVAAVFKYEF